MTGGAGAAALRRRGIELQRAVPAGARRLTVLASFNLDLLPPLLVEALDRRGLAADVRTGGFGQIAEAILDPTSDLGAEGPQDLLLVPAAEDLLGRLFSGGALPAADQEALVDARLAELRGAVQAALDRLPGAAVYVVAFGTARAPAEHVLSPADPRRGQRALLAFLAGVRDLAGLSPRVVVVDWDWHVHGLGSAALTDERLWYLGRMRLNPAGTAALADLVARHAAAQHGTARKVVAVDLDGTLWGGVLGEVGVAGLQVGEEGVALAFADVQRELLRLRAAGVVLVCASKNDRPAVVEAFERHPGMVLSLADFAADRITWQDKATGLRELAAELDLGIDSFVFLDDNPVEREWIRQALPEVAVPELPEDPARRPAFLRGLELFDRVALTDADERRADGYAAQWARRALLGDSPSFADFLRSLEQEVLVEAVTEETLPRAAQLCARTNQFNLTTVRHSAADLEAMLADDAAELYTVGVRDRFGDSGITGLAILRLAGGDAEIDTFLLSCRVLGRRVEDALLAFLAGRAAARGARRLVGRYVPTARNGQAAGFYPDRGFTASGDAFVLDPAEEAPPMPDEMTIKVNTNA